MVCHKRKRLNKHGSVFDAVPGYIITITLVAIILAVMAGVLTSVQKSSNCPSGYVWTAANSMCYTTSDGENYTVPYRTVAFNVTANGLTGLTTLGGWQSF